MENNHASPNTVPNSHDESRHTNIWCTILSCVAWVGFAIVVFKSVFGVIEGSLGILDMLLHIFIGFFVLCLVRVFGSIADNLEKIVNRKQ